MSHDWKASVTVAAVIEREGRFLLVEEETDEGLRLNQPAGHLDPGESLINAVIRETLEETAHVFVPTALLGCYMGRSQAANTKARAAGDVTYVRFAFTGELGAFDASRPLDTGIVRTVWMSADEIRACRDRHRTPLLLACVEDYLRGKRFPLDVIHTDPSALSGDAA
jgi:8-oxo-dGTP pyrophosphatase MutT (NUDIX family)